MRDNSVMIHESQHAVLSVFCVNHLSTTSMSDTNYSRIVVIELMLAKFVCSVERVAK